MANDYASMAGWGQPPMQNQYGQPDYLAGLTPTIAGLDVGGSTGTELTPDFFSMKGLLGGTDANGVKSNGWGGTALNLAQGFGNAFLAMKQYGLAKDTLNANKQQFALNFGAQQKTTNARLEDRQRARIASNPGAYVSVGDYMKQNGI